MKETTEQNIFGQKTFFIVPDSEMIPEAYIQDYLCHGYECYIIPDDKSFPITTKVQTIVSLFPESLLIFDTTQTIKGIEWESYIQELQHDCGDKVKIGVIYSEKWDDKRKTHFKSWYSDYARVEGGLIGLEPGSVKNFDAITKILVKNKVLGRRKAVRANCPSNCTVSFTYNGNRFSGSLVDVSISHFCTDIVLNGTVLPIYEKIPDASVVINGTCFSSDIVLILRREVNGNTKCIFMFIKNGGLPGLSGENEEVFSPIIYSIISRQCSEAINNALNGNS